MEFRCENCNRSFRVPDSKVINAGIKFKCTKCGKYINITAEDVQAAKLSSEITTEPASDAPQIEENRDVAAAFPAATPATFTASDSGSADTIHPLVSGSLAGSVGGIGCAIPVLALTLLGIGAVSAITGGRTVLVTGTSVIGFGILIGIMLASFQARTESRMFGFPGVLMGTLLGIVFGIVQGMIVAAGSGAIFSAAVIISASIGWGFKAFLLSLVVVFARRNITTSGKESTKATISGSQLLGVGLALLTVFLGIFGDVRAALSMKTFKEEASQAYQGMASYEGLEVTNSSASWDATGDLVLSLVIENKGDAEKKQWCLLAKLYDGSGNVLTTVRMLTGKQMYTQRDYEIMGRRGANVRDLMMENMKRPDTPLPAHGTMNVEMRVMEPPAEIASFDVAFQPFDPLKMLREELEEAKKQKASQQAQ